MRLNNNAAPSMTIGMDERIGQKFAKNLVYLGLVRQNAELGMSGWCAMMSGRRKSIQ